VVLGGVAHTVFWAIHHAPLTTIPKGFEAYVFTILTTFLSPIPAPQIRWFSSDIACSINLLTYLLTYLLSSIKALKAFRILSLITFYGH